MGLRIEPGGASWSYRGFHAFRRRLAEAEGFDLDQMEGFGGDRTWNTTAGDSVTPLEPLLYHSDCDGYLDSWDCEQVLPRLRAIVASWPTSDYYRQQGELLIVGMEHTVEHGCAVSFT
jgi:hypothetical protein